jgi:hypothetical protein
MTLRGVGVTFEWRLATRSPGFSSCSRLGASQWHPRRPSLPPIGFYNFKTRRPRTAHANALRPEAYVINTHIARLSEAYIVLIDKFTKPVATFACVAGPTPARPADIHTLAIPLIKMGGRNTHQEEDCQ